MAEINLLPIDLSNQKGTLKQADSVKKLIIVASGFFLTFVILGIGLILFFSNQLDSSMARQSSLTQQIKTLENVEQKLILVKDRLTKINIAQAEVNATLKLETLNQILSTLPANVTLDQFTISTSSTLFTVTSKDSLGMATFLNKLVSGGLYKNVSLANFEFTPDAGYSISMATE